MSQSLAENGNPLFEVVFRSQINNRVSISAYDDETSDYTITLEFSGFLSKLHQSKLKVCRV